MGVFLSAAFATALALTGHTAAGQPDTTFGGGIFVVGQDIAPGTYQTQVPGDSAGCYWARLGNLGGELESILANENVEPGDVATVAIKQDDAGFDSSGCGTWRPSAQVGTATPVTVFGGGTWIVGEDIWPGTYKATVPEESFACYWARVDDLSGGFEPIIANDNRLAGDRITVDIKESDAGFTSRGCGTWERSGG